MAQRDGNGIGDVRRAGHFLQPTLILYGTLNLFLAGMAVAGDRFFNLRGG